MFGASSKLGRGGGGGRGGGTGGGAKRFPAPQPSHRPSGAPGGRQSLQGSAGQRNRSSGPNSGQAAVEETFSLVSGNNPLTFAMIIRLVPDLVEEIRRVEAQGGNARIKFDANPHNPLGNVSFSVEFDESLVMIFNCLLFILNL